MLSEALTPSERTAADRFFVTAVGQKYVKHSLLQIHSAVGVQAPEPPPHFLEVEYGELEQFATTSTGKKFINGQVMQSMSAKKIYSGRIQQLMGLCKAKQL